MHGHGQGEGSRPSWQGSPAASPAGRAEGGAVPAVSPSSPRSELLANLSPVSTIHTAERETQEILPGQYKPPEDTCHAPQAEQGPGKAEGPEAAAGVAGPAAEYAVKA